MAKSETKTFDVALAEALASDPELGNLYAMVQQKRAELKEAEVALGLRLQAALSSVESAKA